MKKGSWLAEETRCNAINETLPSVKVVACEVGQFLTSVVEFLTGFPIHIKEVEVCPFNERLVDEKCVREKDILQTPLPSRRRLVTGF